MSSKTVAEPQCTPSAGAVAMLIEPKREDLGGFSVRRALPSASRRMVGPFIFFDHIGPAEFPPGEGIQVRPHPHIGLATITYLFEGEIIHRDSLGYVQAIQPGAVNLMTAGRGIVHSERARQGVATTTQLHGIQCWMALPDPLEECEPSFVHYPGAAIPRFERDGADVSLIVGEAFGHRSPVTAHARTLYMECRLSAGGALALPDGCPELAVYVVAGAVDLEGIAVSEGVMAVMRTGASAQLSAADDSHVLLVGGDPVGERHIWWNFVSSSKARIEQAKLDWRDDRFGRIPGETEFIPLPE